MQNLIKERFQKCTLAAPDRILVATDLTDTEWLLPHAVAQAKASGSQVTLVHALRPLDLVPMTPDTITSIDQVKILRDTRLTLMGIAQTIKAQGIECTAVVHRGNPLEVIAEEVDRTGATRVIAGTHGRGKLGQLVLGSVVHQLLDKLDIPIFAVGPNARNAKHTTPHRVLHPVSFLGDYRDSVRLALDIAQTSRAELTLLHVLDADLDDTINPERTRKWAEEALSKLIPNAEYLIPPVHICVTTGDLADEINRISSQIGADWIVLGANASPRSLSLQETLAYKVLTMVNCPVLTLRHHPCQIERGNLEEIHFTSPL